MFSNMIDVKYSNMKQESNSLRINHLFFSIYDRKWEYPDHYHSLYFWCLILKLIKSLFFIIAYNTLLSRFRLNENHPYYNKGSYFESNQGQVLNENDRNSWDNSISLRYSWSVKSTRIFNSTLKRKNICGTR
jgi:hypothetical protein